METASPASSGALESRTQKITEAMKLAAAEALADLVSDEDLSADYVIPAAFDPRAAEAVASAVKKCAEA